MTSSDPSDSSFLTKVSDEITAYGKSSAISELLNLIDAGQYIGDLLALDYNSAEILIHDSHKIRVGGVPHGCLLIASRLTPEDLSSSTEDNHSTLLLLRVSGTTRLNSDIDLDRARFERVQRSNDTSQNYDDPKLTDQFTLNLLRYSGIKCRILGTFSVQQLETDDQWQLHFGADIDNFFAGQGMKIYKPSGEALKRIVNLRTATAPSTTRIGCLRYSAAMKGNPASESVPIEISAEDFIAQRTALFGMTRTGKSNTTKMIASALFRLRQSTNATRVGQLIFDPNGEYANDNPQDQGCIRNLKYSDPDFIDDVHTYGSFPHPYDEDRHITKFNFYGSTEPLTLVSKSQLDQTLHTLYRGKQIINDALAGESAGYIREFCNADLTTTNTDLNDWGEYTRLRRRLFVYRSILAETGFNYPKGSPNTKKLFGKEVCDLMSQDDDLKQYIEPLKSGSMSWEIAGNFVKVMAEWVRSDSFKNFDRNHAAKNDGRNWSDSHLLGLLRFYEYTRARSITQNTRQWHDLSSTADYADTIVQQVREGKLVIVDQLLGDPDMNRQAAERIAHQLFAAQQRSFSQPRLNSETGEIIQPPPVIVYAEEAHTLLPKVNEDDTSIWSRIAKEGAKFNIGMIYSTQEPSSIQTNILKNTENWFIAHLNNTDETNQIRKFKDFADFTESIINVEEVGLIKVRTRSSYYTIPVQMDLFEALPAPTSDVVEPNRAS